MPNWVEVGTGLGVGGVGGALDQLVQNRDEKQRRTDAAAGRAISMWKEFGTYYNYGVPLAVVIAAATNTIRSTRWLDRLTTLGGALAGRKITAQVTKAEQSAPWRPYPGGRGEPGKVPIKPRSGDSPIIVSST